MLPSDHDIMLSPATNSQFSVKRKWITTATTNGDPADPSNPLNSIPHTYDSANAYVYALAFALAQRPRVQPGKKKKKRKKEREINNEFTAMVAPPRNFDQSTAPDRNGGRSRRRARTLIDQ